MPIDLFLGYRSGDTFEQAISRTDLACAFVISEKYVAEERANRPSFSYFVAISEKCNHEKWMGQVRLTFYINSLMRAEFLPLEQESYFVDKVSIMKGQKNCGIGKYFNDSRSYYFCEDRNFRDMYNKWIRKYA